MSDDALLQSVLETLSGSTDLDAVLASLRPRHGDRPAREAAAALRAAAAEFDRTLVRADAPTAESARARAHADALDARIAAAGGSPRIADLA